MSKRAECCPKNVPSPRKTRTGRMAEGRHIYPLCQSTICPDTRSLLLNVTRLDTKGYLARNRVKRSFSATLSFSLLFERWPFGHDDFHLGPINDDGRSLPSKTIERVLSTKRRPTFRLIIHRARLKGGMGYTGSVNEGERTESSPWD